MATTTWTGAVSGDYGETDNWTNDVPQVGVTDVILADSDRDINAGLNQSAIALTTFEVYDTYTGRVGLPGRGLVNRVFLSWLIAAGLDSAIIDPTAQGVMDTVRAAEALAGRDEFCMNYIRAMRERAS